MCQRDVRVIGQRNVCRVREGPGKYGIKETPWKEKEWHSEGRENMGQMKGDMKDLFKQEAVVQIIRIEVGEERGLGQGNSSF